MNFIDIIQERGFVHQMTDEAGLRELLKTPGQVAYIGFDCTAKSLHVGSLLQIMLLRWWQKCGHKPIVLLGGGTTKIGDPSGKDESRPPLSDAQIQENMDSLKQVFSEKELPNGDTCGFIKFGDTSNDAVMVNNDEWLSKLSLMDMLALGRHFSVNRMVKQKSVQLRLERDQEMSLLEFNYSVMQAYDFVKLSGDPKIEADTNVGGYNCRIQLGGSDQWGNIVAGIELHRRLERPMEFKVRKSDLGLDITEVDSKKIYDAFQQTHPDLIFKEASFDLDVPDDEVTVECIEAIFGITSPLLTTSSGAKMGKTAAGAVWLNADLLSPYDYWQFWRNTEDADVAKFLKLFTEIPLDEIAAITAPSANINDAKIRLATEATTLLHGSAEAEKAAQTARDIFTGSGVSDHLPVLSLPQAELEAGVALYALIVRAGLAASNGEARRLIQGNGVKINDAVIADENWWLTQAAMKEGGFVKLSVGKKKHLLVKAE